MKRIRNSASLFLVLLLPAAGVSAAVGPGTTIETFDGTIGSWDRVDWVPGSLTMETMTNSPPLPDSVQFLADPTGSQLQVKEVYHRGSVHLELDAVPTTEELRVDATMFQGDFSSNLANWGVAVVLFFDPNNYVSLNRVRDGGGGWISYSNIGGVQSSVFDNLGQLDNQWIMQGINLTEDEVQFFASPGGGDQFGSADFDGQMTQDLSAMNFTRPAAWTGACTVVVGKGWDHAGGDPWDDISDLTTPKIIGIDTTRVRIGGAPDGIDIVVASTNIMDIAAGVTFETEEEVTYHLESTDDPVSGSFTDTGAAVVGSGTNMTLFVPAELDSTIYRVAAEQ